MAGLQSQIGVRPHTNTQPHTHTHTLYIDTFIHIYVDTLILTHPSYIDANIHSFIHWYKDTHIDT